MTTWKTRTWTNTARGNNLRAEYSTKSRKYMLGSFLETVLTAITDPKDDNAIQIKCDPAYLEKSSYSGRVGSTGTQWKTRTV